MPSVQFSSATSVQFTVAANKGSVETQGGRIWPESMRFSFTSPLSGGCEVNGTEFFEDGWDDVGLSAQIAGEVMRCRGACRHIITVMRPTKLTPKVVERIEKAVSLGNSYDEAARSAGIHPCTYYRWRARGRTAKSGKFRAFCKRIDAAEAKLGVEYLEAIRRSIVEERVITKERVRQLPDGSIIRDVITERHPPDITGAMWWLERRFAGFGRKVEHESLARERFEIVIVDPNPASTESAGDQTGNMALPAAGDLNETPEQGAELPFGSERGNT